MKKYCVMYNPYSDNNNGEINAKKLDAIMHDNLDYVDMTQML